MKVAVTSHAYVVPENRMLWQRFAQRYPDSSVTLVVPDRWVTNRYGQRVEYRVAPEQDGNYAIIPLPRLSDGRGVYHSWDMALRRVTPDVWYVAQERYDLSSLQAITYGRLWSSRGKIIGGSTVNIGYTLRRLHHRWKESFFLAATDAIVAMNEEAANLLRAYGYRKPILVQHGIGADEDIWRPRDMAELRARLGSDGFVVGYVGALIEAKGLLDLAQALAQLDGKWSALFVGDGPLRHDLQTFFDSRGLSARVHLVGYMPHGNVPPYVNCMDILVLPSRTVEKEGFKEQFGLVLVEAMLSGVAVVGSDSGAISDVIGDAGLIFPEGNVSALAACLQRLHDNPALRCELAERGRQRALERFSTSALADQFHDFCADLLAGRYIFHESVVRSNAGADAPSASDKLR